MKKIFASIKEYLRKKLVSLKRSPHTIPLVSTVIACAVYTFNLSDHSNAAIYVTNPYNAVMVFAITLLSILTIFTYLGAHEKRKVKPLMLSLAIFLVSAQIVLDFLSLREILLRIETGSEREVLYSSASELRTHIVWLCITLALIITKPLYGKLLGKINTSVSAEGIMIEPRK